MHYLPKLHHFQYKIRETKREESVERGFKENTKGKDSKRNLFVIELTVTW